MDFLELFNAVALSQKSIPSDYVPATALNDVVDEDTLNLDSLDVAMTYFVLAEAYGIPEDGDEELPKGMTVQDLYDHLLKEKTADPEDTYDSIEELLEDLG